MTILLLFISLFALIFIGFPIAIALIVASLLAILYEGSIPSVVVLHQMVGGMDSFPLLSIPFFVMAGALMNQGGITHRIFDFAQALVGWLRGGLGHVNVGASVLFSGMSGAAVADAGGLGAIEINAMKERGYDTDFAVGLTAASSTIGPIIPPSLPMIIYGVLASESIGKLFAAGLVPGLLMALALSLMVAFVAYKRGYQKDAGFAFSTILSTFKRAGLSLMTPFIIVGGIVSGFFTATEAAVVACVYAIILTGFVYKTLTLKRLLTVSSETVETTSMIMLIIGGAAIFSWVLTSQGIDAVVADFLAQTGTSKVTLYLCITLLLFIVGCFMETIAAITILTPILLPIAIAAGIEPVQFGIIMLLNLMIGLLTPPLGMVLFVLARVSGLTVEKTAKATMPFLLPLIIVLVLTMLVPEVTLWLPNLLYPNT
ncbi:sialic acid TRAP transporter large permease protein SiaM [Alteromonas sp. KC3]|uniref:TRAP transporter large permease n=1 Tax=unclassified Alteromonas TaxID=2614992 RepID=UPI001920BD69|nr:MULTISPECIES: TRAP transporter large permease [unclassified Alteromonas]BCO18832.1 sialic acid TRAP transporter large permease protein SiaM [Alteromonas sp. KC3]BCO22795.1 sialic acid TRAP transporter large permease protein SiaM [Alteromonas sp. KC14]